MFGCSPRVLFPNDHAEYDSIQKYNYSYKEHTFYSRDKTPLHGLHIQPKIESKGFIVVTNGLYRNMSDRFSKWLWIVDSGYDLFIFDYRGFGKSDAEIDIYGFRDDVNSAVEYAHMLDENKSITLVGQSMGGTFVIDAMIAQQYTYVDLVVADSTFTSFSSILNTYMLKSIVLIPLSWLPYTFNPDDLNSIENIEQLRMPILFVTGDDDWIVNYDNSKELYAKAKCEKSLWIVKDAGHVESFDDIKVRESFLNLLQKKETLESEKIRYY